MKTIFKKMFAGALLAILFLNANVKVMAQVWNIPSNGSTWTTSNNFIGTNAGTPGAGDLLIKTQGATRMTVLGATGQVGIGLTPVGNTSLGGPYYSYGPALQILGPWNNNVPAWSPPDLIKFTVTGGINSLGIGISNQTEPYLNSTGNIILSSPKVRVSNTMTIGGGYSGLNNGADAVSTPTGYNLFVKVGMLSEKIRIASSTDPANWTDAPTGFTLCNAGATYLRGNTSGNNGVRIGATLPDPNLSVNADLLVEGNTIIGPYTLPIRTGYKLFVKDGILTEKIKIALSTSANWADFVFDKNYKLLSLNEVESFIKKNHHLPEIPSAEEVYKEGIDVAQMDAKLLQKIEELTLYIIEMKNENEKLKTSFQKQNNELKEQIENLQKTLHKKQ